MLYSFYTHLNVPSRLVCTYVTSQMTFWNTWHVYKFTFT
jgi:hypothetical protein